MSRRSERKGRPSPKAASSTPTPPKTRRAGSPRARSGPAAPAERGVWRWPVVVVLLVAAVAGVSVQRDRDDHPPATAAVDTAGLLPVASAADALSSTWYCAGGTATGTKEGDAEQTVQIANAADHSVTAKVTVVPSEGQPVTKAVDVPARGRADLVVSSVVKAPYAAAVIEIPGGQAAVSHVLGGPTGKAMAACSSSPSSNWYIPAGTSKRGTRQLLAVFNPFPSEAVVGVSFETDDGARTPQKFEAIVVPGQRVALLDISAVVTVRTQIATTVNVRSGRVVVDQIQLANGTQDTAASLAVTPGAPQASPTWWFADGPAGEGLSTTMVVQNPSDDTADVQLQIRLDRAEANGSVAPFEVSIPAHQYSEVDVSGAGRVPQGVGYTAAAVSTNGVPIVAERLVSEVAPASPTGMTITMGSPVTATNWLVPVASAPYVSATTVVVTNPSSTDPVTISVSTVGGGALKPVADGTGVQIAPGGRGGFQIPTGPNTPEVAVDVESDGPVVVEARTVFVTGGLAEPLAIPVQPSATVAASGIPAVPPGEVVPSVPGAGPGDGGGGGTSVPNDLTTTTAAPASTTPPAGANPGG